MRENEGVAARILLDFDADSEKIRNEVIRVVSGPEYEERKARLSGKASSVGQAGPEPRAVEPAPTAASFAQILARALEQAATLVAAPTG